MSLKKHFTDLFFCKNLHDVLALYTTAIPAVPHPRFLSLCMSVSSFHTKLINHTTPIPFSHPSFPSCTPALLFCHPPQSIFCPSDLHHIHAITSVCAHFYKGLTPFCTCSRGELQCLTINPKVLFIAPAMSQRAQRARENINISRLNVQRIISWLCTRCLMNLNRLH